MLNFRYTIAAAAVAPVAANSEAVPSAASRGPALSLLIVASLSLLVLGLAALHGTIRRRPATGELEALAWSDSLTGLANRRRLDHDILAHSRHSGPNAVIMVDVDHFKSVNDTFGHPHGDAVLRAIGEMLANQIRYDDVVYRYGGEEFCILLPNTSTDGARVVADRIVKAARSVTLPDGRHITVSVGVAASSKGDVCLAVETADQALYAAKDRGRDQAVTAA